MVAIALGVIAPSAALAQAATQSDVHLDDSSVSINLYNPGDGYVPQVHFIVFGANLAPHDAVRIDWMINNAVVATMRCPVAPRDGGASAVMQCEFDRAHPIPTPGNVQVALTYLDDDGHPTPLRTLTTRVGRWWDWTGMNGSRPTHDVHYQVIADDLLGMGWLVFNLPRMTAGGITDSITDLRVHFWAARTDDSWPSGDAQWRCTVNGTRLPDNELHIGNGPQYISIDDRQYRNGQAPDGPTHYYWTEYEIFTGYRHGARDPGDPASSIFLSEHPGAYICQIKLDGNVVREFRFNVDATGAIAPHPEAQGAGALLTSPGTFVVDTRIPATSTFDTWFDPAALRATGFWGRRWVHPEAFREAFAGLPAARGRAEPAPPAGAPAPGAAAGRRGH